MYHIKSPTPVVQETTPRCPPCHSSIGGALGGAGRGGALLGQRPTPSQGQPRTHSTGGQGVGLPPGEGEKEDRLGRKHVGLGGPRSRPPSPLPSPTLTTAHLARDAALGLANPCQEHLAQQQNPEHPAREEWGAESGEPWGLAPPEARSEQKASRVRRGLAWRWKEAAGVRSCVRWRTGGTETAALPCPTSHWATPGTGVPSALTR